MGNPAGFISTPDRSGMNLSVALAIVNHSPAQLLGRLKYPGTSLLFSQDLGSLLVVLLRRDLVRAILTEQLGKPLLFLIGDGERG